MKKLKILFQQAMTISTGILLGIGLEGFFAERQGYEFALGWEDLLMIVVTGLICAIPSLIWLTEEEMTRGQFIIRLIGHCLLLYGIVAGIGYVAHWYGDPQEFALVSVIYFLVYLFVWLVSYWNGWRNQKRINRALKDIQDQE